MVATNPPTSAGVLPVVPMVTSAYAPIDSTMARIVRASWVPWRPGMGALTCTGGLLRRFRRAQGPRPSSRRSGRLAQVPLDLVHDAPGLLQASGGDAVSQVVPGLEPLGPGGRGLGGLLHVGQLEPQHLR